MENDGNPMGFSMFCHVFDGFLRENPSWKMRETHQTWECDGKNKVI